MIDKEARRRWSRGRRRRWAAGLVVAVVAYPLTSVAVATPGSGAVGTVVAQGALSDGLDVQFKVTGHRGTSVTRVKGPGNAVVQRISVAPGGHTGWHTHGGPAVAAIASGELTLIDGDDPGCTGTTYTKGQAFVDPGQGHVHIGRNLGTETAEVWVTYLLPEGALPRIDAADPGNCQP